MKDMMEREGYLAPVRYSAEDHVFYGRVECLWCLITFAGSDVASLEKAFVATVEDSLESYQELMEP